MFISKYKLFIPDMPKTISEELFPDSILTANAVMVELLNYGIYIDTEILRRIMQRDPEDARAIADTILKAFTIGDVNPPLFDNWEDREDFTFKEVVLQVMAYVIQISGNDLADPEYMEQLRNVINFTAFKKLSLGTQEQAGAAFMSMSTTGQSREQQRSVQDFAQYVDGSDYIKSDESRVAVLLSGSKLNIDALTKVKAKPADILRLFAARKDFTQVNLPSDVLYDIMTWQERKLSYEYLSLFEPETIMEAMGNNRSAWIRFFKHTHLFQQEELLKKFSEFAACAWISVGSKFEKTPKHIMYAVKSYQDQGMVETTAEGALVYRTFASRIQTALADKDFIAIRKMLVKRPGYLLRNITTISNAISGKDVKAFTDMCGTAIKSANQSVLFSLLQINVNADYRIIDVKGNTIINKAEYSPTIGLVQDTIRDEIKTRYGVPGKILVDDELKNAVVPFLARNQEIHRGTKISFADKKYLHFFMHWIQTKGVRTDLDHSHMIFKTNGRVETIAFYRSANPYIKQSGDITNAPAPAGATEYSVFEISKIPKDVEFIAPVINVFTGDDFSELQEAYAGFMFNDTNKFTINSEHVRYDLSQPARVNIPFVLDVVNKEIIVVDFNIRIRDPATRIAADFCQTIRQIISASKDLQKLTIGQFADLLSGPGEEVEFTISNIEGQNHLTTAELSSLIE